MIVAAAVSCAPGLAVAADPSHAALIAAAKQAPVKNLDFPSDYCDSETAIEIWLKGLVGAYARSITWTGGKCQLVNNINPLDAASWPYCAQAKITLVHPKAHGDRPMIEIYMERPQDGHPGEVYAFRSLMMTKDDGPDYLRTRYDFENEWNDRFPPPADATRCKDD
jgi:hypothetical protein